jgi:hypothetical protein
MFVKFDIGDDEVDAHDSGQKGKREKEKEKERIG